MSEYKPFSNPYPRLHSETEGMRESFDKIASRIKERYAEDGEYITDDEAIKGARTLIGYVELLMKITERNLKEGRISSEEIEAAKKRGKEMGWCVDEDEKPKLKKRKPKKNT